MGILIFLKNPAEAGPTWNNVFVLIYKYKNLTLQRHSFYFGQSKVFKIFLNPENRDLVFKPFEVANNAVSFKKLISHFNVDTLKFYYSYNNYFSNTIIKNKFTSILNNLNKYSKNSIFNPF